MNRIIYRDIAVFLPMPVFLVVEDVGWWQGEDGSAVGRPYRNAFPRQHCLADYQALARLAERLGMRLALAMVLCEWDRDNCLSSVTGATWMDRHWNNCKNQGPWLDEAAEYLRDRRSCLELGFHGLCHEFWHEGRMERSEFHDQQGNMRAGQVIKAHLDAFGRILEQNGFTEFPRLFSPPALCHSFGNGRESIQALLHAYGIRHVITRFSRARFFTPPQHEKICWECGVGLVERGLSPVSWDVPASLPSWDFSGPILALHWGNLLHPDPERTNTVVDAWAKMLLAGTSGPERILAEDFDSCWQQAAVFYFGKLSVADESLVVDLTAIPQDMPDRRGIFFLKLRGLRQSSFQAMGAKIISHRVDDLHIHTLQLQLEQSQKIVRLRIR